MKSLPQLLAMTQNAAGRVSSWLCSSTSSSKGFCLLLAPYLF
ncbi:hypothetical protein X975_09352, partial [Stegodyphus mimosarum]